MTKMKDIAGMRFGRLLVKERDGYARSGRQPTWRCVCDCGEVAYVTSTRLNKGETKSCGCLRRDVSSAFRKSKTTHGMRNTPEYRTWTSMRERCRNPNSKSWTHYGGRGISVCKEWDTFEQFFADMGPRPPKHSLDRIDNNDGYHRENCRWATKEQQCNNKRNNRLVTFDGRKLSVAQWAREIGVTKVALSERLQRHPVEIALTMPIGDKS